ncbi:unnamed protein product, partial [Choristocarpus tenellus]
DYDDDNDNDASAIYLQAYACRIFRDSDAAHGVEQGDHLRPLSVSQDPEEAPLMLDRFDVRWMVDPVELTALSRRVSSEEHDIFGALQELRYADLPHGDHSLEVEGLGQFAPEGSYAHVKGIGGLGGDEVRESPVEDYGYYGPCRVESGNSRSPESKKAEFSHVYINSTAAAAALDNKEGGQERPSGTRQVSGELEGDGEVVTGAMGEDPGDEEEPQKGHEFVADFVVPEGVVVPRFNKQHAMMVGTARTTVRSPQV